MDRAISTHAAPLANRTSREGANRVQFAPGTPLDYTTVRTHGSAAKAAAPDPFRDPRQGASAVDSGSSVYSAAPSSNLFGRALAARPTATRSERRASIESWIAHSAAYATPATSIAPSVASSRASSPIATLVSLNEFNDAYRQLNADITHELGDLRGNLARVLTTLGTWGSVGGAVAMGLAAPAALTGLLSGVGVPHGFAAAIFAVGVGLAGLAFSVLTGALVRKLSRRRIAGNAQLRSKIIVLREIEAHLRGVQKSQRHPLDAGDAALLKNTRRLLAKVDPGMRTSLRKQGVAALAAPFALFTAGFAALRRHDTRDLADGGRLARVKKAFHGAGLTAELGATPVSAPNASLIALDGNGERWLRALQAPAVPVVGPVGTDAAGYRGALFSAA